MEKTPNSNTSIEHLAFLDWVKRPGFDRQADIDYAKIMATIKT